MVFVTDTHSLIWYLTGDERIGKNAKRVFADLEVGKGKLIISIVVLLETLVLVEKGKIKASWEEFNEKVAQFPTAVFYPIGFDIIQNIKEVNQSLDLHDRILVTTAKIHKAGIITKDKEIKRAKKVKTVW